MLDKARQDEISNLTSSDPNAAGAQLQNYYNRLGLLNSGAFNTGLSNAFVPLQQQEDQQLMQAGLGQYSDLRNVLGQQTQSNINLDTAGTQRQFGLEDQTTNNANALQIAQLGANAQTQAAQNQSQNQLTGSLIGAGSTLGSAYLLSQAGLGAGAGAAGAAGAGALGAGAAGAGALGAGATGTSYASGTNLPILGADLAAGGLGYYAADKALGATQSGDQGAMNVGAAIGGGAGAVFGGPVGAGVGAAAGTAAGKASNRLETGIQNSAGQTAADVASMTINPIAGIQKGLDNLTHPSQAIDKAKSAISDVGQSISHVFGGGTGVPNQVDYAAEAKADPLVQSIFTQRGAPHGKAPEKWWDAGQINAAVNNFISQMPLQQQISYLNNVDPKQLQQDMQTTYGRSYDLTPALQAAYKNVQDNLEKQQQYYAGTVVPGITG